MNHTPVLHLDIDDLAQLRQGCTGALRRLFDRYYAHLVSIAQAYVSDEALSKDIAQEVFTELWLRRQTLHIEQSLGAYLRRMTTNRALNHLKARKRMASYDRSDQWHHLPDPSPTDLQHKECQEELEARLREAIAQLPEKCRIVFMLSRFERRSHREIAEVLGISVKTVENQILRAMHLLRRALENNWFWLLFIAVGY